MARNPAEVCTQFFSELTRIREAEELLSEIGDRVAQFDMKDGSGPFYVQFRRNDVPLVVRGSAKKADLRIEATPTACEEMFRPLGTSFAKARFDEQIWTRPAIASAISWFAMLVRIGQGR